MKSKQKKTLQVWNEQQTSRVIEDVLGCKWTVVVLRAIANGTNRPGVLTRTISGLSAKVLNQRLRKLLRYSIISRKVFNEIPPKVEYALTPLGRRIAKVLTELDRIENDLEAVS